VTTNKGIGGSTVPMMEEVSYTTGTCPRGDLPNRVPFMSFMLVRGELQEPYTIRHVLGGDWEDALQEVVYAAR